jgi:23S rRNA pseudouridine1911/1915/1917 synthase
VSLRIPAEAAGQRLDRFLAEHFASPRNQVQRWLREGLFHVDGAEAKAAHVLRPGEVVSGEPPAAASRETLTAEPGALRVLFEDADLVVLDKPAGLTVHPGAGRTSGTLAHRLLHAYPEIAGVGGPGRPGIVHRLDKDTSGVLVVARSARAYQVLARAFANRRVRKVYDALVYGAPQPREGEIAAPIARHATRRKEMAVRAAGRPARTGYRTLAAAGGIAWLEIDLHTGRTHQIRVHMKHLRHPLIGDPVYGEARWKSLPRGAHATLERFPRPALHARQIAFEHPTSGATVTFRAPVPDDLIALWTAIAGARPLLPPMARG